MLTKYDPSMSSRDYLVLARRLVGQGSLLMDLSSDEFFDYAVHDRYVGYLLDPENWAHPNRRPRVFVHSRMNQSGNLEVRWGSNPIRIFFPEDFDPGMALAATSRANGSLRPIGELMWVSGFQSIVAEARWRPSESAFEQAIVFGYKARLDELVREIGSKVDVVGALTLNFQYDDGFLSRDIFGLTIPEDRMRALQRAADGRG